MVQTDLIGVSPFRIGTLPVWFFGHRSNGRERPGRARSRVSARRHTLAGGPDERGLPRSVVAQPAPTHVFVRTLIPGTTVIEICRSSHSGPTTLERSNSSVSEPTKRLPPLGFVRRPRRVRTPRRRSDSWRTGTAVRDRRCLPGRDRVARSTVGGDGEETARCGFTALPPSSDGPFHPRWPAAPRSGIAPRHTTGVENLHVGIANSMNRGASTAGFRSHAISATNRRRLFGGRCRRQSAVRPTRSPFGRLRLPSFLGTESRTPKRCRRGWPQFRRAVGR